MAVGPDTTQRGGLLLIGRFALPLGAVVLLAGLAEWHVMSDVTFLSPAVLAPVIIGLVLLLLGVVLNARALWQRLRSRQSLAMLNVSAQVVLAFILLVLVNAIIGMSPQTRAWRLDVTYSGRHSISSMTRNVLEGLESPITINVIVGTGAGRFGPGEQQIVPLTEMLRDTVGLYEAASPSVIGKVLSYDQDKDACLRISTEINETVVPDAVIVQRGARHEMILFNQLVKGPDEAETLGFGRNVAYVVEPRLTEAIVKVTERTRAKACLLSGHGELAAKGPSHRALNEFGSELARANYELEMLNLQETQAVPADCEVLIIAGPREPFTDAETKAILDYLEAGGSLFALCRAAYLGGDMSSLGEILGQYNVAAHSSLLVMETHATGVPGQGIIEPKVLSQNYGEHPVTQDMESWIFRTEYAFPLSALSEAATARTGLAAPRVAGRSEVAPLVYSSMQSWGEANLVEQASFDDRDMQGPCVVALAVQPGESDGETAAGPRLVVASSHVVVMDELLKKVPGNRVFAMNAMNWLAHKEYKLGIPPQSSDIRELQVNKARMRAVFWLTVVAAPLAAALCGCVVWYRRNRF